MLSLAVPLLLSGCASNHHVSPWGGDGRPPLAAFAERTSLEDELARIDKETAALKLTLAVELDMTLPRGGGAAKVRGYEGEDAIGRRTYAVRVATGRGVAMALGPLAADDVQREQATELVPALIPADTGDAKVGAYRSGTDVNGDGDPDVVVRSERGGLEVWRISLFGSSRYEVEMEAMPTRALDVDGAGSIDLAGEVAVDKQDAIGPRFMDVATFEGGRYSDKTAGAKAWHARRAGVRVARASDADRLRDVLERAWHAVLAGEKKPEAARKELEKEAVPAGLRAAFDRHVARIAGVLGR